MHSKQAWRLTMSPQLLLARILKAKYFPRESFFTAELGDRPSTTWRCILKARGSFSQGLRKRIGNGENTSIWGDHWLPSPSSGQIIMRRPTHSTFPDKVLDLISWKSWIWNYSLISDIFWPVDVRSILQVSFGSPDMEDKLVWVFSKTGQFTVRSCYYNLLNGKIGYTPVTTSLLIS